MAIYYVKFGSGSWMKHYMTKDQVKEYQKKYGDRFEVMTKLNYLKCIKGDNFEKDKLNSWIGSLTDHEKEKQQYM